MSWHAAIPWDWWRGAYLGFRHRFFSKAPPDGPYLRIYADVDTLRRELGGQGYAPQETLSYDKSEDLNLAFQFYLDRDVTAPKASLSRLVHGLTGGRFGSVDKEAVEWWQTHIRGWQTPTATLVTAHFEPSARHEDSAHIEGVGYDRSRGMEALRAELQALNIQYENYDGQPPARSPS